MSCKGYLGNFEGHLIECNRYLAGSEECLGGYYGYDGGS